MRRVPERVSSTMFDGPEQSHDRPVVMVVGGVPTASSRKLVVRRAGEHCWGALIVAIVIVTVNAPRPEPLITAEAQSERDESSNRARWR